MTDRSPNATKEEMQITIDLLRARGDSSIEMLDALIEEVESLLLRTRVYRDKLREVDDRLGITPQQRKNNAVVLGRRLLGKLAEGKTDEEVLKLMGGMNGQPTN